MVCEIGNPSPHGSWVTQDDIRTAYKYVATCPFSTDTFRGRALTLWTTGGEAWCEYAIYNHHVGNDAPESLLAKTGVIGLGTDNNTFAWYQVTLDAIVTWDAGDILWIAARNQYITSSRQGRPGRVSTPSRRYARTITSQLTNFSPTWSFAGSSFGTGVGWEAKLGLYASPSPFAGGHPSV